ncbi:MAG: dihydroflavonol 4-reductase [Cyanobium sp. CACIAM 14]|nr:MAG: dihydroflavonol 4-reductase [Cyanobium sp. CACIAM 14]
MPEKVFVTGGAGFVGTNLIHLLLEQGYQVKALARSSSSTQNLDGLDIELVQGDLNDTNLWSQMRGCEALFHVAAHYSLWQADRDRLYRDNVLGTRAILQSARRADVRRVVYTSSVAAIGTGRRGEALTETHQTPMEQLIGNYKKSKFLAELEAKKAVAAGQDVVIVNPTSPIGPWDRKPTPTGDIILRFLRRQMPFYLDTGLNFIDVRDVAWGHLLALEKGVTGQRYILGHQNMTLKSMLDLLAAHTGLPSPSQRIPHWLPLLSAWVDERLLARLGKSPSIALDGVRMASQHMYYDSFLAVHELGLPQSPVTRALATAIDWFEKNGFVQL